MNPQGCGGGHDRDFHQPLFWAGLDSHQSNDFEALECHLLNGIQYH